THEKQNAADDQKAIHHLPSPNGQGDQHDPQSTGNTDTNQNTFETASTRASSPFGFFSSRTLVIPIVLIFLNLRNFVNVHRTLSLTLDWGRCLVYGQAITALTVRVILFDSRLRRFRGLKPLLQRSIAQTSVGPR